ncbi:MAG: LacI family DNA-binding transcriptional regulator [Beutenbergiaceae bacterium]
MTDVAKLAGVSVGTVSNVLNRPERVAEPTLERVQEAIRELGFVRNASARQLRSGEIRTIGAVVLDVANPFFTEMLRGIEDRLATEDFTLMLASSDEDPDREARYLRLFAEHGVGGVLATPAQGSIDGLLTLRELGIPVVLLDATSPVPELASVAVDDIRGAALAAEHLLDRGHRRIAFVNGPLTLRQCADRREGVLTALRNRGLDPGTALTEVTVDNLNADGGAAGVRLLLDSANDRPTALFCVNDLTALGALQVLREHELAVPEQVAVVGYDDVSFAAMLTTPLTSVRQPTHTIGWTGADMLLRASTSEPEHVMFEPELIVRASSDAPLSPAASGHH